MSKPGLTDEDLEVLAQHADAPDANSIRATVEDREHAERSSRFDWAADPRREYCQRCGVSTQELYDIEAGGQSLTTCKPCIGKLERRAARVGFVVHIIDRH